MKILHRSKRALPPLPQVAELIHSLSETQDDDLADVLGAIDHWRWPRSDLNAWIGVLNKLDAVLEDAIRTHAVDELQLSPFPPQTKRTVCEILRFERLLLENSTNRKTFASYDRINSLLSTSDLDVLVLALNLLLRPAQQYSAQPAVARALSISTPRLLSLAKRWSHLREYGLNPLDLVTEGGRPQIDALQPEAREVQFSFYKTDKAETTAGKDVSKDMDVDTDSQPAPEVPKTPVRRNTTGSLTSAPPLAPSSGAVTIQIDEATLASKSTMEILADVLAQHKMSGDDKFDLMCRIRAAQMLFPDRALEREKLVTARLIAIAIFVHTHTEQITSSSLFLYEPDLTTHVAELLALDRGVPMGVQIAAIAALDAMARYRSRIQDVLAAVNAGVNHGTLMALFRKTVMEVAHEDCQTPHAFVDAFLSFVTFLASHATGGSMIVGAGLVPLLIQIIENRLPQRLPMVSKAMQLVDNVLYSFPNAFQLFCNNRGVDVLVERIAFEVDDDIRLHSHEEKNADAPRSYGLLPVVRSAALKHILRSMHRMMQSSGTAEGLRGLIDTSLLQSIKKIMEHRALFGPNVLPISINIMATFVHNEPTSLSIIQEARLPETFYRTIDSGLEPVIEVIQAIPNAIGALCLNQVGQDQLAARPTVIPGFFSIFTSERHQRVLQDKENSVIIGSSVDELIRHHPSIKPAVFDAIRATLNKIEDLGQAYKPPENIRANYDLVWPQASVVDPTPTDSDMHIDATTETSATGPDEAPAVDQDKTEEDGSRKSHENVIVSFLDVVCRFLEGLFQHPSHCKDFLNNYGALEQIGRLTALPCLPYDFGNSVASDSLVQVVRTMFDASPNMTMGVLCDLVKTSLGETREFWSAIAPGSRLLSLLDPNVYSEQLAREAFRRLVALHVRVMLISDVYATVGYAHGRSAIGLLQILMGRGAPEVIPDLGSLHRALVWENVQIKATPAQEQSKPTQEHSDAEPSASRDSVAIPEEPAGSSRLQNGTQTGSTGSTPAPALLQDGTAEDKKEEEPGLRALRHIATSIPNALTPFFQSIIKLFSTRRHPDEAQKQSIKDAASRLSGVLTKHLELIDIDGDRLLVTQYYTSLLGLVTTFLIEERTASTTLYTVLLDTFYQSGGMKSLMAICHRFLTVVEELSAIDKDERTESQSTELGNAYGGLKIALHLIHPVVSTKPIFESPQTSLLIDREKKDGEPGYFEPRNFLVRMRLAVLPFVHDIWSASWLATAPSGLVRSVIQVVLEIVNGEGEENTASVPELPQIAGGAASLFRPTVPDEARITQITDMGFPRWAAERALARTQNNVNAATELLLSNQFRFHLGAPPPQDEGTDTPVQEGTSAVPVVASTAEGAGNEGAMDEDPPSDGEEDSVEQAADVPVADAAQPTESSEVAPAEESKEPVKTSEQWREELNAARKPLKANVGSLALRLVDEHPTLVFDVQSAFVGKADGYQKESIKLLVRDVRSFSAHAIDSQEQQLAVRCRLLAIVLNESPSSFVSVISGEEKEFMDGLLALVLSAPINAEADRSTTPKWLAALLLVVESLITLGEEPRSIPAPKEGDPLEPQELISGPLYREAHTRFFDFALRLLALPSLTRDDLISALRLLVILTRDHGMALEFVKRDGVPLLFKSLKSSSGGVSGCQSYITLIIRHIVEDQSTLRSIMKQEVRRFLTTSRQRSVDITSYVRSCNAMALRDPKAFLDATESAARLERPYGSPPQIMANEIRSKPVVSDTAPVGESADGSMAVDATTQHNITVPPEHLESVVHFLFSELIRSVKPSVLDSSFGNVPPTTPSTATTFKEEEMSSEDTPKEPSDDKQTGAEFYYRGFIMQCLTELLFSYDVCKLAFLSYSTKKRGTNAPKESTGKFRTFPLQFLLNELISYGSVQPEVHDIETRKRVVLCNWAMSVTVALCIDTTSSQDMKEISPELVHVRKFVLEAVSRAIKDPLPAESLNAHYGRLLALADLCHRLLTVKYMSNSVRKSQEDSPPTHIAKIMLEKNFVSTLTTALAEVDLNFPNIRGLVQAVLRPLEMLSRIAIKMSRASDKTKGNEIKERSEDGDSFSDEGDEDPDEDEEHSNREETPDLYRNSALGMFGGEIDDQFGEEDDMEDEGEEEEDVDMDFGEESDGTSEESDVEVDVEVEEDLEEDESGDEDDWDGEGEDQGDDLVEEEGGSVPEMEENVDEDEDEAEWEDIEGGDQIAGIIEQDDGVAEEDMGDMAMYGHEDEDDGGMGSDDELDPELGLLEAAEEGVQDDVFRLDNTLGDRLANFVGGGGGNIIVTGGLPMPVVHDGEEFDIFGRHRITQSAPDTVTHPLLLEGAASERSGGHGRSGRRNRGNISGGALGGQSQDLLAAIEDVIGGPAVQLFHTLLSRRVPGTETIRLDVPPGTLLDRHGLMPLNRRNGNLSTSLQIQGRSSRSNDQRPEGREFDPLHTLPRWGEEVKIVHGKFASDRFSKLGNHIILRLLPEAIKRAEEARKAAEREQELLRQAKAKEEADAKAREEEEKLAAEKAEAEAAAAKAAEAESAAAESNEDVEMRESAGQTTSEVEAAATASNEDVKMRESVGETHAEEPVAGPSSAGPGEESTAPERITVLIHGSPVDITDTGIDPTFLEALPDDMREEVVNQHIRDQHEARVERPADSQISAEFLDALPPEIRAEIIQQERLEQARRRTEEQAAQNPEAGGAVDIDPATFIASLDPQLRQDVLMDQDDGFIQTLPSHMIAEAGMYRVQNRMPSFPVPRFAPAVPHPIPARKPPVARDAIQLLDKGGIAVLIRLLFFPQILKKGVLFKILVNLCENTKTRTELFNILLNILQEGATDLATIDRSFSQITFRNPKTPTQTPKAVGKQKSGSDYLNSLPVSQLPNEIVPDLISQRCLEALSFIVSSNENSSLFFLTEHELPAGLRRGSMKKGKGKEKQASQTQYPVVLLLNLLDRQSLLKTPSILESLVGLLDNVTRPLTNLKEPQKSQEPENKTDDSPPSASTQPAVEVPNTTSSETPATAESSAVQGPSQSSDSAKDEKTVEEKILFANPPQIPHAVLRLIVNILTVGECGAKPFHSSLSLIQHLSYIPDAREVIAHELRAKAQELGQSLQQDLDELAKALDSEDPDVMASSVASKFSSPSSDQAKLLRVLKTIDYMYSPKSNTSTETQSSSDVEKIQSIYESFRFSTLWKKLGDCLSVIEKRPETEHIATVLLPLIESLMVVCKYVGSTSAGTAARVLRASSSPRSPTSVRESMEELFVSFTDAHRKVLNVMVRNNPSLMSGSFSLLVNNPRVLDFDNKRNYFNQQLHRRPHREHYATLQLHVRRQRVFEDSFQQLQRKTGDQIKYGKLSVRFQLEEGVDAGGLTREWFQILARQMFDPNNALFEPCAADRLTYQPNKASWVNPEHLSFFKFVGRLIGKAIYDGRLLEAYFARSLYRQVLGKPVDYRDVEWIDPDYFKSLCWILENDPSPLDLNFSIEGDEFGVMKIVKLKENGDKVPVTFENRREFVQLSAQYRLYDSIKEQLESLLNGFYEIIPKDLVSIFNEQELELLISGTPDIDVDEWRAATEYNGYTSSDPVIVWWWRALKSFNRDERAKVLSFATGTSRVPLNGFVDLQGVQGTQRFSIHRAYGDSNRLPQAHTCFNQIDLPQYSSYEMLRQQLLLAINEGGEGFGFA